MGEKEECFAAFLSVLKKVNDRDADMRSHIVLSMFKVAAAEANVPEAPPVDAALSLQAQLPLIPCPPPPCQSWTPWTSCSPHPPPPPLPSSQDNGHDQPESPVIQIIIRVCHRSRETRKRGAQSVKEKNTICEKSPLKSGFSALRKIYI